MTTLDIDESAFDAYAEEVDVYERTWQTEPVDPQHTFLASRPQLKAALFRRAVDGKRTFTADVYAEQSIWSDERRALQSRLLATLTGDESSQPPGAEAVYFLIGLPGSGKSSSLRPLVLAHAGLSADSVRISDADDLRTAFPEYAGGVGSGVVQEECSELMYDRRLKPGFGGGLQGAILNSGRVTIVDVIGSPTIYRPWCCDYAAWVDRYMCCRHVAILKRASQGPRSEHYIRVDLFHRP